VDAEFKNTEDSDRFNKRRPFMKICISAQGPSSDSLVDPRFGRAKFFIVHDDQTGAWESIDNMQNLQAPQGAGIQSASHVVDAGCTALICGHCGPKAFTALSRAGVSVYTAPGGPVREAVESFKRGELKKIDAADVEEHW
jgi:predicted Fe-Mo cluster-binding NifX family protein